MWVRQLRWMLTEERSWLDHCMIYSYKTFHHLTLLREVHFKTDAASSMFFASVEDVNYHRHQGHFKSPSNRMSNFDSVHVMIGRRRFMSSFVR